LSKNDALTCNDTITVDKAKAGQTWAFVSGPSTASITQAGLISGMINYGVYKFRIYTATCNDTISVRHNDCRGKIYDLHLDKLISKKTAKVGDLITYTLKVWNEGNATAHNIVVKDTLNAGVQYVSNTTTKGAYNPTTKLWSFDSLTVGDTARLNITVRILAQGVWYNTAEITSMTEKDQDSTPADDIDGQDDLDRECFSVPIEMCTGQVVELNVPAKYTSVVWFRNGVQIATGNIYTVTQSGSYTFSANNNTCPAGGCCPYQVIIADCCPKDICIPVTFIKRKK
jgi:uncharacterized repeat protein (TIGR01451 family)